MESIGEKLKAARERNNLTIEQIARETHVAKRFLKALEDEDFAAFPGETYAMGFLRNYAEYLGLNAEELIGIYRNIKIQEQPLPMNELLETRPRRPSIRLIAIAAGAVVVLAVLGYVVYRAATRGQGAAVSPAAPGANASTDFLFNDEVRTRWFSQGDAIAVPMDGKTYRMVISAIAETLTIKVPGGTLDMGLGKERYIDLDGDSTPEIRVVWNDVDRTSTQKRVNLGLYRTTGQTAEAAAAAGDTGITNVPPAAAAGSANPPVRAKTFVPVGLMPAAQAGLFILDFTFKNDCLFRYLVDNNEREDRFFQKGEQFSIDTARTQVTIWLSNAGAARMRVQGKDFELGALGEVATRRIAWRKDAASAAYVLELSALY